MEKDSLDTYQSDKLQLTIMQHGILVNQYFLDLYSFLQFNTTLQYNWKLPDWIYEHSNFILEKLLPIGMLSTYQIYHDIGKPYCKTYDLIDKKPHFYNHAKISSKTWDSCSSDKAISKLIYSDMDIHTMKDKDLDIFSKREDALSLLITGLAEIHANAEMFGGINSTSFKIKYKQINTRGKALLRRLLK